MLKFALNRNLSDDLVKMAPSNPGKFLRLQVGETPGAGTDEHPYGIRPQQACNGLAQGRRVAEGLAFHLIPVGIPKHVFVIGGGARLIKARLVFDRIRRLCGLLMGQIEIQEFGVTRTEM
jgi:hypothetical protein